MCGFCENIGIGLPYWNFLPEDDAEIVPNGIKIEIRKVIDKTALVFTNSADEYGAGAINIRFCPMCGRELRESKDYTKQIKHELEEKCSFETDRLVKLPFNPIETANMLINATYKAEIPFLEKQVDRNVYDIDDLEQIAEHLLVYCKHNKEKL